jgi:hypothetical protein
MAVLIPEVTLKEKGEAKMRNSLRMIQYTLYALLIFALSGCGANSLNSAGNGQPGTITAKLTMSKGSAKTAAAAAPASITKIRLKVTGPTIPTASEDFDTPNSAQVNVYPGSQLIVAAQGFDASGKVIFEGFAVDQIVTAGADTPVAITMVSPKSNADSTPCLNCHDNTRDATGQNIVANFKQSGHYADNSQEGITVVFNGNTYATSPGCAGCHGPSHNDVSPSTNGRCYDCHASLLLNVATNHKTFYIFNGTAVVNNTCTQCHEAHNTKRGLPADYAASGHGDVTALPWQTTGHNWRTSGSAVNFSTTIPATDCVRCHTADGFVQFTTAPQFTNVAVLGGDGTVVSPLVCSACHTAGINTFSTPRAVAAVNTFYNISTVDKVTKLTVKSRIAGNFPDVGQSNMCNACHSARVIGPNLTELFNTGNWNLSNASFQNSHYMAAAGNMYMKTGFKNFTSLNAPAPGSNNPEGSAFDTSKAGISTYLKTLTALNTTTPDGVAGGQNSAHRRLGTPLLAGSEDYLPAGGTALTTNGPCVTCHMKAFNPIAGNGFTPPVAGRPGQGHSLKIDEATAQELCLECHADAPHLDGGTGTGVGKYTTMKNLADMEKAMLEPQSEAFQNGLTLIKKMLEIKYKIVYDGTAYPYFFDMLKGTAHTSANAVSDWTRAAVPAASGYAAAVTALSSPTVQPLTAALTQVQAYRLMGACFNLNVLARDPAANVHARTYSQRLVFDTVDFLDNNLMDFTSLTTARALTAAAVPDLAGVYTGKEANVLIAAPVGGLATESMAWLAGTHYSDSKGQTPVPLRLRP